MVTGLTGFKGQWLGAWLSQLGAQVSGFGLPPNAGPDGVLPEMDRRFDVREIDIRNAHAVNEYFEYVQPEFVFHLAAQPLVRLSYSEPVETFATNVMGTVHVLDAARRCESVRGLVNVTSDKCYENREWHWAYREEESMGGHDPYSASKGCSEIVTASFRRSFAHHPRASGTRLGIASGRAGNVIGGGDWSSDRLIPDIVRAVLADQPVIIRRPESIRPWQHVLEAISGYLQLGVGLMEQPERYASGWNFGPAESGAIPVRALAQTMIGYWNRGRIVEEPIPTGPHEAKYLKLDSSKARAELGWMAILSVQERIEWTIDWYRDWSMAPTRYWPLMETQIAAFQERWDSWISSLERSLPASVGSSAPQLHAA